MASSVPRVLILFSFLISTSFSFARQASSKPHALILPLSKDATTRQYITQLNIGTPLSTKRFIVDLGGRHLWMDCDDGSYVSSTFKKSSCGSPTCSVAKATCGGSCLHKPAGCNDKTCHVLSENTIKGGFENGVVSRDTISLPSTDGAKGGPPVSVPDYIFACANAWNRSSLAGRANGMIGLGREQIALPEQLSSSFNGRFGPKFAICLPSGEELNGVMFIGDAPYIFYVSPEESIDFSSRFQYTKLYFNTITGSPRGPPSPEYFVKVTSILVNEKPIPIKSALLNKFQANGNCRTKISTVEPYTKLETTIFKSLFKVFDKEMEVWNVSRVPSVPPFRHCYSISKITMISGLGLKVPEITFEFENNKNVRWKLYGANTMAVLSASVGCFAFVDGGKVPKLTTPITIGTHQFQDHLLQFDLASNRFALGNFQKYLKRVFIFIKYPNNEILASLPKHAHLFTYNTYIYETLKKHLRNT